MSDTISQVRYRVKGTTTWINYDKPVTTLEQVLTGLQPNTDYELEVVSINAEGAVASAIRPFSTTLLPPGPPGQPVAAVILPTSIVLNWAPSSTGSGTTSYQVLYRLHNIGSFVDYGQPTTGQSITINGLTANTNYDFEVVAMNAAGSATSPVSAITTLAGGTLPSAPTNLMTADIGTDRVTLSWSQSASGTIPITYQPQYRLSGASLWSDFGSPISGLSAVITALVSGTSYDFQVVAINAMGSTSSAFVSAATIGVVIAPSAPGVPAATAITSSSLTLTWSASASGTAPITYQPQRRLAGSGANFTNYGAPISALTVDVTGLASNTSYNFRIMASNSAGTATSPAATATTLQSSASAPSAPTSLAISDIMDTSLTLSWGASSGTSPIVYKAQFKHTGTPTWIDGPSGLTTSASITGLTAGTPYDLHVIASNSAGVATSGTATATTSAPPVAPSAPTGLAAGTATASSVALSWTASASGTAPINYQPQYRIAGSTTWINGGSPTIGTNAIVSGLQATTSYDFRVSASNGGGAANSSFVTASTAGTTWNPADKSATMALSGGDLIATNSSTPPAGVRSTTAHGSGKYYAAFQNTTIGTTQNIGLVNSAANVSQTLGSNSNSIGINSNGRARINRVVVGGSGGDAWTAGGTVEMASDFDIMRLWTRVNGVDWGSPVAASAAGSQTSDGGAPLITGPVSLSMTVLQALTLTGLVVTDSGVWPHDGPVALNVNCGLGIVHLTPGSGTLTTGGPNSLSYSGPDTEIATVIASVRYKAPADPGTDTLTIEVWDQLGNHDSIDIAVTTLPMPDPAIGIGGFDISLLGPGPYYCGFTTSAINDEMAANYGASPPPFSVPFAFSNWDATVRPIPGDTTGITAQRVADFLESGGTNVFPNGQDGSGLAGVNTAAEYEIRFDYLTASTGMGLTNRIYANGSDQTIIPKQVSLVRPTIKWYPCYAQGSDLADIIAHGDSLKTAGCIAWVESANEANFGVSGGGTDLTHADCLTIQQGLYNHFHPQGVKVAAAALVDTGSNTYVADYWNGDLTAAVAASDYYMGHDYPNSGAFSRDFYRRTGQYVDNGWSPGGGVSETHPLLYNGSLTNENLGAYLHACGWLAGFKYYGLKAFTFFSLEDYPGFRVPVGLFNNYDHSVPRPPAKIIHNFFALCPDATINRRIFPPSKLNYTITGLPPRWAGPDGTLSGGGQHLLLQGSNGKFYLFIWNEQDALNLGTTAPVVVHLGTTMPTIVDYSITNPVTDSPTAIQTRHGVNIVNLALTTEVRVLVIDYPT